MSTLATVISDWVASTDTQDWERQKIEGHPGLYVVKMPARKNVPAHAALEINPADQFGNPTKRSGIFIRATAEMQAVADLFGGKIPKKVQTLCDAMFDGATVPQTATADMLVIE